ncbi:hypothetical protein ANO14919_048560 [Xylariales sp. No.14919]|nr:hypothetical protein ANO14919_048560 [Xylariales sp. No.14919]
MLLTAPARRLLRALLLFHSAGVMLDLQRDGRGRPAVDGWSWCAIRYAIRCAIDRAGTADSCSTAACVELELWPSQSSISRRPPLSSSSSHCADKYDDHNENDGFKNGQRYFRTSGVLGQRDSSRLCADTISLRRYTLRDSKTLSSPPISATRPVRRADSFDGIANSANTSCLGASSAQDENEGSWNRRSNDIASAALIRTRSEEPTPGRQQTKSSVIQSRPKRRNSDQSSQAYWRGYWG